MVNSRIVAGLTGIVMSLLTALSLSAGSGTSPASVVRTPVRIAGIPVCASQSAVVNMAALAQNETAYTAVGGQSMPKLVPAPLAPYESAANTMSFMPHPLPSKPGISPQVPSPPPAQDFAGLDDIANLSTGYSSIPPDTDGAVGLTKVMSGLNNNYRIFTKDTGAVVSTVGNDTFWGAVGGSDFFDPKTLYDPINGRWLVVMLSDRATANSSINIGVSLTDDPSGSYYLFRINADAMGLTWADFPGIGFNKDYVAVNVNMYTNDSFQYVSSKVLAIDYAAMRKGSFNAWFLNGSGHTSSPAATYSRREKILYVPTQPYGNPGLYHVDTITGDPATGPVYTVGTTKCRGISWSTPDVNILPQAPEIGGGTPMGIECQDDMIRSTPVVRDGFIYYTQTVGLPAGGSLTRTSILWTKLKTCSGDVADGGLIDDPTATASNGGKWYAYPHIAVNKYGDAIVGFSQFSSAEWASAAYAVRAASDPAGTMRVPLVYKAGEDAYQKTYGSGRNRWGDFSKAQVDPSNDEDLWVVNEYAKPVPGGSYWSGVWGTWWARVDAPSFLPSVTGFTPAFGSAGTVVTVTGSNFTCTSAVTFNGIEANFHEKCDRQITATVPVGATSGPITVTTRGGSAASMAVFTVNQLTKPKLSGLNPACAKRCAIITLSGNGFGSTRGKSSVNFDGMPCMTYEAWNDTWIVCRVPAKAGYGPVLVTVTTPAGTSNSKVFTVQR
jgi:hypothetical protein